MGSIIYVWPGKKFDYGRPSTLTNMSISILESQHKLREIWAYGELMM